MSCRTPTPSVETVIEQPTPSDIVNLTFSLLFFTPLHRTFSSRIDNLVEISTLPKESQIGKSLLPLLSPYNIYRRSGSLTRRIRSLISSRISLPKEYVQASKMDQCSLQATSSEQYVTLEIPPTLFPRWKNEGYSHLYFGAVRLILTLHGKRGLPVIARISLLDTRFLQYEYVVIGTCLTTLHAGSVVLAFFPNYNLSLRDPNLC